MQIFVRAAYAPAALAMAVEPSDTASDILRRYSNITLSKYWNENMASHIGGMTRLVDTIEIIHMLFIIHYLFHYLFLLCSAWSAVGKPYQTL